MNDEDEPPLPSVLWAFMGYGIELEYMIVDSERLSILPVADRLLRDAAGNVANDVVRGRMGWSNELVMHVVEVKNVRPGASLALLPDAFLAEIREINNRLHRLGARLMPGGMHPWMDPRTETRLWPHGNEAIYSTYDRIFDSRSHGWANLQSMHINLPFGDDEEFERLHAAVRLVLPILPALAASSPIADARITGWADYRMRVYCDNASRFPSIAGLVVPETITSRSAYQQRVLAPMYREIAAHDPEKVLQHEWLNSRGAIARFDRNAIEIRVVDTQECPRADIAIAAAAVALVRRLYRADELVAQQEMPTVALAAMLQACVRDAEQAQIDNRMYLRLLGFPDDRATAGELWDYLIDRMMDEEPRHAQHWGEPLQVMLESGPLARRILRAVGDDVSPSRLRGVYRELCDCLQTGSMFTA
jgi:glutamate---cysteine ligase / carboxylate-amine ligase